MKPLTFERIVKEFKEKEDELLRWKAGEYASGADRLKNFREVARLTGRKMSEVALMYLLKHIQSISQQVSTGVYRWEWETGGKEGLKQRIADAANYLHLLAACLEEEAVYKSAAKKEKEG
jgi:hypothetical protein